jgi:hypothetical protein
VYSETKEYELLNAACIKEIGASSNLFCIKSEHMRPGDPI